MSTVRRPDLAYAYVNHGRWVIDCLADGCNAGVELKKRVGLIQCQDCYHLNNVEFPSDADEIIEVLERRPDARNRNWFPQGHDLALRYGVAHGQSVADLVAENVENMGRE